MQIGVDEREHGVAGCRLEGADNLNHIERVGVHVHHAQGLDGVGVTGIFTNALEVALVEHIAERADDGFLLERIVGFARKHHEHKGLRCLHLTFEVVDVLTGNGREVTVGVVFAFLHAGQGSDVLLHEGAERVFVDVTGEEEVKVAHRCKALAVDLAYAVIVGLGQVREFLSGSQWVVAVDGGNE